MTDLVGTCPKDFWSEWIAEGDAAGAPWSGTEWGWYINGPRPRIDVGDRLYIVAHGRLRGYAPVTALRGMSFDPAHGATGVSGVYVDAQEHPREWRNGGLSESAVRQWCICREGDAVAVTIAEPVLGFQGLRRRWWEREDEIPFPDWQTFSVEGRRAA